MSQKPIHTFSIIPCSINQNTFISLNFLNADIITHSVSLSKVTFGQLYYVLPARLIVWSLDSGMLCITATKHRFFTMFVDFNGCQMSLRQKRIFTATIHRLITRARRSSMKHLILINIAMTLYDFSHFAKNIIFNFQFMVPFKDILSYSINKKTVLKMYHMLSIILYSKQHTLCQHTIIMVFIS